MPALKARLPRVISIRKNTSALARHKQQSRQADANRRLLPSPIRCFGAALSGVVEPECKLNAPIRPRKHMRCAVVLKRHFGGGGTQTAKLWAVIGPTEGIIRPACHA